MVTEKQIDDLYESVKEKYNEIALTFQALGRIKIVRPAGGETRIPKNPDKFRDYTQVERDLIYADIVTELQRIKANL